MDENALKLKTVYQQFYKILKDNYLKESRNLVQIQSEYEYFENLIHKEQINESRVQTYLNIMGDMFNEKTEARGEEEEGTVTQVSKMLEKMKFNNIEINLWFNIKKDYNFDINQTARLALLENSLLKQFPLQK